jgi:hypothetical protein
MHDGGGVAGISLQTVMGRRRARSFVVAAKVLSESAGAPDWTDHRINAHAAT